MSEKKRNKGGRNPKLDPAVFRYTVRFSEEEHNRFLSMFEKSGVYGAPDKPCGVGRADANPKLLLNDT